MSNDKREGELDEAVLSLDREDNSGAVNSQEDLSNDVLTKHSSSDNKDDSSENLADVKSELESDIYSLEQEKDNKNNVNDDLGSAKVQNEQVSQHARESRVMISAQDQYHSEAQQQSHQITQAQQQAQAQQVEYLRNSQCQSNSIYDSGNGAETKKKNSKLLTLLPLSVFSVFILLVAGYFIFSDMNNGYYDSNLIEQKVEGAEDGNNVKTELSDGVAYVAEKATPSVVTIVSSSSSRYNQQEAGVGSGVFITKNGYVLTNKHVVENGDQFSVVDYEGNIYENVKLIGEDPLNDIAIVKVENSENFKPAEIGNSYTTNVGQHVVAIGSALGQYQNTVTTGVISGKGRPVLAKSGDYSSDYSALRDLIQTDAAINTGNSGGPLLNLAGEVIGINTASNTEADGIGFAIPVNAIKGVIKYVKENQSFARSYLGVNYVDLNKYHANELGVEVTEGSYVYSDGSGSAVKSGSPAEKAGIKSGDIIKEVNGIKIDDEVGLLSLVSEYAPGEDVYLVIDRDGEQVNLTATLATYPR